MSTLQQNKQESQGPLFRVLSDVYLEIYKDPQTLLDSIPWNEEKDATSFLLLCGDVGYCLGPVEGRKYRALMAALAARFRGVFLVAGNHEYYQCSEADVSMGQVDAELDLICRELHAETRPVVYLQKGEWTIYTERAEGGVHVTQLLGCTLWSPVTAAASTCMNDCRKVGISAPYIRAIHVEHSEWLRRKLGAKEEKGSADPPSREEDDDKETRTIEVPDDDNVNAPPALRRNTVIRFLDGMLSSDDDDVSSSAPDRRIVMTHHAPHAAPDALDERSSGYYANLFRNWPADAYPDLWVCGHVHVAIFRQVETCAVRSCPHGYPASKEAAATYIHRGTKREICT